MAKSKINFKQQPAKAAAFTGIFAGLFAIGNFIAIPNIASHEHVIAFICATLFGPWISAISSVVGELIVLPFGRGNLLFLPSTLIGDILTSLIIGYGRRFAFVLQKNQGMDKRKSRQISEGLFFIISVNVRYSFYLLFDSLLLSFGVSLERSVLAYFFLFLPAWIYKMAWFIILILLIEQLRKSLNRVYFDIDSPEFLKENP